jgi:Protein of unknown function (DUF2281)
MTAQTICSTEAFVAKLQALPPEQQRQVQDFVEFLVQKYTQSRSESSQAQPMSGRIAGLFEGMGWMSEDFNDPLPDEFWFGEPDPLLDNSPAEQR